MRIFIVSLILFSAKLPAEPLRLFDTHLHYNLDARQEITPQQVLDKLDAAGINRVLLSSTDDEGTQMLYRLAPHRILPALRPYRQPGTIKTWMYDESVVAYLQERLTENTYVAFGEFHAFEEHIDLPVVKQSLSLAKANDLLLHIHGDAGAVQKLFDTWPEARVLWAHAGFDDPENIDSLMSQHSNLWVDLSHRSDISTWAGLAANWEALFRAYPNRFLFGTDTYSLERWGKLSLYTLDARDWLSTLPETLAKKIAYENANTLFGGDSH